MDESLPNQAFILANSTRNAKIARMYTRALTPTLVDQLNKNPAVVLLGPRQVGKTTLALEIAKHQPSIYLDLENPEDLQKLRDPRHYFDLHADRLIILDEIQRIPDLFLSLRGTIDTRRQEGRGNGRFLLLGSASNDLMKQSSESLAGRVHYAELSGLNPLEVQATSPQHLQTLWLRGGFPNSYMAEDRDSFLWRQNLIWTYAERDIPQLGPRIPATTLIRFWTMLAHLQGEWPNASKLTGSLDISNSTVQRYLDLMVDLLLVRRLPPWFGNVKKRLVKSHRIYLRDSGLLHALLQLHTQDQLLGHPILGKSWEGFVIENLINALPVHIHPFFYRTAAGAEIDLVLEIAPNELWAIEIKASRTPTLSKGFYLACQDLSVSQRFVVYTGTDTFSMGNGITALSLPQMIQTLQLLMGA